MIGADPSAQFVEVECADDYYESIDIESARHPQSLLCYEMYGKPLDRGHGAPLRLQMPTKLGYKQAKYLTSIRVTNVLSSRKGYWEDLGYSWQGGFEDGVICGWSEDTSAQQEARLENYCL